MFRLARAARWPLSILLLFVVLQHQCAPAFSVHSSATLTVALAISGYAAHAAVIRQFVASLSSNVLQPSYTIAFDAVVWLQDEPAELAMCKLLVATRRFRAVRTRSEHLHQLPAIYSEREEAVVQREYDRLPRASLLPGTFNTLRMLFKMAGVEVLRALPPTSEDVSAWSSDHDFVLRMRPDLMLFGPLHVPPPLMDGARASKLGLEPSAILVPWACPGSQLLFDQFQLLRHDQARRLSLLAAPGAIASLANWSLPPSTYPERMVWHAMARAGIPYARADFPQTALLVFDKVSGTLKVRDSYGKLRVDFPECAGEELGGYPAVPMYSLP